MFSALILSKRVLLNKPGTINYITSAAAQMMNTVGSKETMNSDCFLLLLQLFAEEMLLYILNTVDEVEGNNFLFSFSKQLIYSDPLFPRCFEAIYK